MLSYILPQVCGNFYHILPQYAVICDNMWYIGSIFCHVDTTSTTMYTVLLRSNSHCVFDTPKVTTQKYGVKRFSCAPATLQNAISDDRLNNSKQVEGFRIKLKTYLFDKYVHYFRLHWSSLYLALYNSVCLYLMFIFT